MRIGFDMLAVQSPHHGARGIGRYAANLVSAILAADVDHEFLLYIHDELPAVRVPRSDRAKIRLLRPDRALGESVPSLMDRLVRENPDDLDVYVVLSPFEKWAHYTPPDRADRGPKLIAVVYDLIPFMFQKEGVFDAGLLRHYRVLESLKRYDSLLAISEATRKDCLCVLGILPDHVVNVSGASNSRFFKPDRTEPMPSAVKRTLADLGIARPFLFNVGGLEPRKNTWHLINAYAALPERIRTQYQLVLTFEMSPQNQVDLSEQIQQMGLEGSVIFTGEVTDETLLVLYQRCALFVFPSRYEGFGLPILEAMHCGAAVLAGNNSSQIEVVGDAGCLCDAGDVYSISAAIRSLIDNPGKLDELRTRAASRAKAYSWERTAARALDVIAGIAERQAPRRKLRLDQTSRRGPRIAFFSPLPPMKSGISDYSAFLLEELRQYYTIDLFHDSGYVPEPALRSEDYLCADFRLFDRIAAARDYYAVVYQMGNSWYHRFLYPTLLKHRGVVTLHDFCLSGFYVQYAQHAGRGLSTIRDELLEWYPDDREAIVTNFESWGGNTELVQRGCAVKGWYLNRRVLDASEVLIVHSPWCESQIRAGSPQYAGRVMMISHGIHPRALTAVDRAAIRGGFGLPHDALILASFGFVHSNKMSPQALDAFALIARDNPRALFVFVGEEVDGGELRRHAAVLGISDRVRFLGRQPAEAFIALMPAVDVGVNLRLPPTNGETSGALLHLLAAGVPTVVTDVAAFSDYPEGVVRKIRWVSEGDAGLLRVIRSLAENPAEREKVGTAARAYAEEHHAWAKVGKRYVEAIERCHRQRLASRGRLRAGHRSA